MAEHAVRLECVLPEGTGGACLTVLLAQVLYLCHYGGKYQLTETQSMVAKLPVLEGQTDTVTMMSYGFDPYLSSWSPYHGAVYAVVSSVAKIVAAGGDYKKIRFTFQEYFRRMTVWWARAPMPS